MALYFFAADAVQAVKIGTSSRVESRVRACLSWSPVPLRIAAVDDFGDRLTETELHYRLRADCLHGEWFTMSAAVVAVMDAAARDKRVPDGWHLPVNYQIRHAGVAYGASLSELQERLGITLADIAAVFPFTTYSNRRLTDDECGLPLAWLPPLLAHMHGSRPGMTFSDLLRQRPDKPNPLGIQHHRKSAPAEAAA